MPDEGGPKRGWGVRGTATCRVLDAEAGAQVRHHVVFAVATGHVSDEDTAEFDDSQLRRAGLRPGPDDRTAALSRRLFMVDNDVAARPVRPPLNAGPKARRRAASFLASAPTATALAAAVRNIVSAVPSKKVRGTSVWEASTATTALMVGRLVPAFPGLTLPNVQTGPVVRSR